MWMQSKEPTCTEPGYSAGAYLCNVTDDDGNVCGDILTGKLEPTGHKFSDKWTHIEEGEKFYHVRKCTADGCETIDDASKKEVNFKPTADSIYKVVGKQHAVSCSEYDECQQFSDEFENHSYEPYRTVNKDIDFDAGNKDFLVKECACGDKVYQSTLTNAFSDTNVKKPEGSDNYCVIISEDTEFNMQGDVTIPQGCTLIVNGTLTASSNRNLIVKGKLEKNNGTIDSKIAIKNEGSGSVQEQVSKKEDLENALKITGGNINITLEEDVKFDTVCLQVQSGSNVTIDLNGKTIERTSASPSDPKAVSCVGLYNNGGILTINGGTIKDSTTNSSEYATSAVTNTENGTLTLEDVTIEGNSYGIQNLGNLTIKGGTKIDAKAYGIAMVGANKQLKIDGSTDKHVSISSDGLGISTLHGQENVTIDANYVDIESTEGTAIYLPAKGTYKFNNCDIKGKGGIDALVGTITLTDTRVTATGNHVDDTELATNGKASVDGSAILLRSKDPYGTSDGTIILNISGDSTLTASGDQCKKLRVYIGDNPGVKNITITAKNGEQNLIDVDEYEINQKEDKQVTVTLNGATISNPK